MHLFLVRHGESLAQTDPALGDQPDTPLSPRGQRQAAAAVARLQAFHLTHIVSSPLLRALETADCLAQAIDRPIAVWPELCEGWLGAYQSHPPSNLVAQFPRAQFPAGPSGEGGSHAGDPDYAAFFERARSVVRRIEAGFAPEDGLALVTHGGLANNLLHVLLRIPADTPVWFELANASISHVRLVPDPQKERPDWPLYPPVQAEVLAINETAHLAGL